MEDERLGKNKAPSGSTRTGSGAGRTRSLPVGKASQQTVERLTVKNFGPIVEADVMFGDLTVLVGPQATGKSVFLQLLKLIVDAASIHQRFTRHDIDWHDDLDDLFEIYFGEGMSNIHRKESEVFLNGAPLLLEGLAKRQKPSSKDSERMFYMPAQRLFAIRDGITHPFTDYRTGDPFCLREFSEKLHVLAQGEFVTGQFFPQTDRLEACLGDLVKAHVFGNFALVKDSSGYQRRIVLETQEKARLPYLVWSEGQRAFVPLLLGFYWLLPSHTPRRQSLRWVVIEEPEMGLCPNAIATTMAFVLELLARDYRVCITTHSLHVLDVIWALRFLKEHGGSSADVKDMLGMKGGGADKIADTALQKNYRAYFFPQNRPVEERAA